MQNLYILFKISFMFICDLHRGGKDDTHYMDKKAFPKWIDTGFSMDQKVAFMDEYVFFHFFYWAITRRWWI